MEEREHAILSASSAHRWLSCTPSARLELEEDTSECSVYAEEGTAAHALAELKLSHVFGKISDKEYTDKYIEYLKDDRYSKYYTKELEEYVDTHVEYVKEIVKDLKDFHIYFEVRVNFSNVVPQGFGTADVLIVTEDTIHIVDLKFGVGVPVSAINNPQLRLYAMGAMNLFPNTKFVKMTINQPRLDNKDTEVLTKEELLKWAFEYVKPRAEAAIKGEGKFNPTDSACKFCKLKGKCKARADMNLEIAKQEFQIASREDSVMSLSTDQLSKILELAPKFESWFKDVQSFALGQLMRGVKIPGFKLVEGRSTRVITDEEKVKEILLSIGLKEDDILKPRELLGISRLESLVGKKLFADLCKDYLIKPVGKLTLAPESDRRPGVSTIEIAESDFNEPIETK